MERASAFGIAANPRSAVGLIVRRAGLLALFMAIQTSGACKNHSVRQPSSGRPATQTDEYFAWEKLPSGTFKQVRKDYFMDKAICRTVIGVLNDMSTQRPRTNWILSQTTDSTFECWPASTDPSEYYKKYSIHSDSPAVVSPDSSEKTAAPTIGRSEGKP
jgi:hypothetical protein